MRSWLSDPWAARRETKEAALAQFRADLRRGGASAERIEEAVAALRAALADITAEEYPTPQEYIEAVEELAARFAAGWQP